MKIFELPIINNDLYAQVNTILDGVTGVKNFVEPFCSDTSMFLNMSRKFNKVVANDISKDKIRILKSFRDVTYDQLIKMREDVVSEFGDIGVSKNNMNEFVEHYSNMYDSDKSVERGLFLYISYTPQIISKDDFDKAQKILLDTLFYCSSFEQIVDIYDNEDVLFFFNPPYIYDKKIFDYEEFRRSFQLIKGKIIYMDVYDKDTLKHLKNSTGKKWKHVNMDRGDYKESIYYNF